MQYQSLVMVDRNLSFPLKVVLVFKVVEEDAEDILHFLPSVARISTERGCTAVFERWRQLSSNVMGRGAAKCLRPLKQTASEVQHLLLFTNIS